MNPRPAPDSNATLVLGMASTAMPFARSPQGEAERWLRILRLHGQAGIALQALGVSEAPLEGGGEDDVAEPPAGTSRPDRDVIAAVSEEAARLASGRGSQTLATGDVLMAVMDVYGADFDRVLRSHGTDRDELLERLGAEMSGSREA
jgi:hypothetical protein